MRLLPFLLLVFVFEDLWGQAEFRAVGGPGVELGKAVIPHAEGAFLVATSKLEGSNFLRGYVAHFDADLEVDWTLLIPTSSLQEQVIDAWSSSAGVVSILTQKLDLNNGYTTVIHQLDSTGTFGDVVEPPTPQNFLPIKHVEWQGQMWLVGQMGNHPIAINIDSGEERPWGGMPGTYDKINDAMVVNGVLVAVGSRTQGDSTSTAIWGMYPLGQLAFERIHPDPQAGQWSEATALDLGEEVIRVIHSYETQNDDDSSLLHSLISLHPTTGAVTGILEGPVNGQRPGRDILWTPSGWIKLSQTDGFTSLDQSVLVTHYSENGTYLRQGAWGTPFEEDPSQVVLHSDGSIWIAGSTRGVIDPSWNAFILRLDSVGAFDIWAESSWGVGIYNDPLFDDALGLDELTGPNRHHWSCTPNPTSGKTKISSDLPLAEVAFQPFAWKLLDCTGREVRQGRGTEVDCNGLDPGVHHLIGEVRQSPFQITLVVE